MNRNYTKALENEIIDKQYVTIDKTKYVRTSIKYKNEKKVKNRRIIFTRAMEKGKIAPKDMYEIEKYLMNAIRTMQENGFSVKYTARIANIHWNMITIKSFNDPHMNYKSHEEYYDGRVKDISKFQYATHVVFNLTIVKIKD